MCSRCHQIFLWFACIHDNCSDCVMSLKIAYHVWLGSFEFSFLVHHGVIILYLFVHDDSLTGKRFTMRTEQLIECFEPM